MTFKEFLKEYNLKLDSRQQKAAEQTEGAVLVLAVPGSGKTTVLVTRLGYMIKCKGINPENILTVTYTKAATGDMGERFYSFFAGSIPMPVFRTINSLCVSVIKLYEHLKGTTAFDLVTDDKITGLIIREVYKKYMKDFPTEGDIKDIRTAISYVKNMMLKEDDFTDDDIGVKGFKKIYKYYNDKLREKRLMDYDDQMVYAHTILVKYPRILKFFSDKFKYICVDEAQDTSKIQHRIIKLLTAENGNVFMVGDEDQSIYGFRAAYPEALVNFEKEYKNAKVLLMEKNYRSSQEIVKVADGVIQKNKDRHPKNMQAVSKNKGKVNFIKTAGSAAQYMELLKTAKNHKGETAVLFRNNESAIPLINLLEKEKIPFSYRQTDGAFFSNRVVTDILNIIKFAQNPSDTELFMQIYYKINGILKLSRAAAEGACDEASATGRTIPRVLCANPLYRRGKDTAIFANVIKNVNTRKPGQFIAEVYNTLGYGEYMENMHYPAQKINILISVATQEKTMRDFLLRMIALEDIVRNRQYNGTDFILSTVHSSKGLEYETVYLMDIQDGILPSVNMFDDPKLYEEERRLFYVAMTRAKKELNIFDLNQSGRASFTLEAAGVLKGKGETVTKNIPKVYDRINHRQFGAGTVIAADGDFITVSFDGGRTRKFSFKVLREKGLLLMNKSAKNGQ